MNAYFKKPVLIAALCAAFGGLTATSTAFATDHGDTALVNGIARNDARLTDFFALNRGDKIAFIIDTNPTVGTAGQNTTIPQSQTNYIFPTDVKFTASVDNHSQVNFDDAFRNQVLGGTIVNPAGIMENFVFTFTFDAGNNVHVTMSSPDTNVGISGFYPATVNQGDLVYVLGSGFTKKAPGEDKSEVKVKVKGRTAPFSYVVSDNLLVFVAPNGGKTGPVTISVDDVAKVTSASPLVINASNVSSAEANGNLQNVINNTAAIAAIQAGDVQGLAAIGIPVNVFAGLRDDPFIRTAQQGKNIAAMAVELPQSLFTHGRQKVLISWGTSAFNSISGPSSDVAGRSFGSMFSPEQDVINTLHPSQHVSALEARELEYATVANPTPQLRTKYFLPCQTPFQPFSTTNPAQGITPPNLSTDCADESQRMLKSPDVSIFDTTKPQSFPNGREMTNDQIDLIAPYDPRVENVRRTEITAGGVDNHGAPIVQSPTVNDVPHDSNFPYLGLPQN